MRVNRLAPERVEVWVKAEAFNQGRLQALLRKHGVAFDEGFRADAYSFLPKRLQKRPGA